MSRFSKSPLESGFGEKGEYCVRNTPEGLLYLCIACAAWGQVTLKSGSSETTVPQNRMITYLFIGHSNMAGRTNDPENLRPTFHQTHSRCWNFNIVDDFTDPALNDFHHQWIPAQAQIHQDMNSSPDQVQCGPGMAFLKQMASAFPDYYFGIAQNAESAASAWKYRNDTNKNNGPPLYSQIHDAAAKMNMNTTIGGVVMMLCLADGLRHPDTYKQNVKDLVAMFRNDLDLPQLPVFISDYEYGSTGPRDPGNTGAQTVIQANQELPGEIDYCYLVPTSEWSHQQQYMHDDHHYNLAGYVRWAQELITIITNNNLGPASLSDTEPPSIPSGINAANDAANSIRLSWTASTDNDAVQKYAVFIDGDSAGIAGQTFFTIENTAQCRTYTFTVKAFDFSGNASALSAPFSFESLCTSDTSAPSTPDALQATDTTATSITLLWRTSYDNNGIAAYYIYTGGELFDSTADTTIRIEGLDPATSYSFSIRALDTVGNISLPGETLTVTTKSALAESFPLKINCGGDTQGEYMADQPYSRDVYYGYITEGNTTSTGAAIAGTDNDAVYQSIRYGDFDYRISVPRGDYIVTLLMAESFAGKSAGSRLFTVSINNSVLNGCPIDIFDSVGADAALDFVREITVQNNAIDISFRRTQNSSYSPVCCGFIVEQAPAFRIAPLHKDTLNAYDTLKINWQTNEGLVDEARIWISADYGISWHEISPGSISDLDPSWENFAWEVIPVIEDDTIAGKTCAVRITDYDKYFKIVANDQVYISPDFTGMERCRDLPVHDILISETVPGRGRAIHVRGDGKYRVHFITLTGKHVYNWQGTGPARIAIPYTSLFAQNLYVLQLEYDGTVIVQKIIRMY
ncbi:MAG: hypothetical protein GF350_11740 [Chitinivibrionales bacterium]|nr:hypothetical protein [Chitinivibrionales bacterium]